MSWRRTRKSYGSTYGSPYRKPTSTMTDEELLNRAYQRLNQASYLIGLVKPSWSMAGKGKTELLREAGELVEEAKRKLLAALTEFGEAGEVEG